jgi:hypothetical protein
MRETGIIIRLSITGKFFSCRQLITSQVLCSILFASNFFFMSSRQCCVRFCLPVSSVSWRQVASVVFDLFAKVRYVSSCQVAGHVFDFVCLENFFSAVIEAATSVLTFLFVGESLLQSCFWKFFQFLFVSNSSHQNSPTFVCCSATFPGSCIILIHPVEPNGLRDNPENVKLII